MFFLPLGKKRKFELKFKKGVFETGSKLRWFNVFKDFTDKENRSWGSKNGKKWWRKNVDMNEFLEIAALRRKYNQSILQ